MSDVKKMRGERSPASNHLDWLPPEAYPAIFTADGMSFIYQFPDFGHREVRTFPVDPEMVRKALGAMIRDRKAKGLALPYPSSPASIKPPAVIVMIPTEGWDIVEEEDHPE